MYDTVNGVRTRQPSNTLTQHQESEPIRASPAKSVRDGTKRAIYFSNIADSTRTRYHAAGCERLMDVADTNHTIRPRRAGYGAMADRWLLLRFCPYRQNMDSMDFML